jgi:hypothetical protein
VPGPAEEADEAGLEGRLDAAEDARRLGCGPQVRVVQAGEVEARDDAAGDREADPPADRLDGGRVVAGDHLEAEARAGEAAEDLLDVRAQLLREPEQGDRLEPVRERRAVAFAAQRGAVHGAGEEEDAHAVGCDRRDPLVEVGRRPRNMRQQDRRRAHHVHRARRCRVRSVEADPGPAALRGEGDLVGHRPGRAREGGAERLGRPVRCGRARRQHREDEADLPVVPLADRLEAIEGDPLRGERPRLVDAQRVHAGHRLDRVLALDERAEPGDAEGTGCVRDGDHDREALGDERDEDGRGPQRLLPGEAPGQQGERDRDRDRGEEHEPRHGPDRRRDLALERRPLVAELARLREEPVREAVGADPLDLVDDRPAHDRAAREERLAGDLRDRVGLAGQERFVELGPALAHGRAVEEHLVAAPRHEEVAEDDLRGVDGALHALAQDVRPRPVQERDPVELPLRPRLLDDADEDVRDDRAGGEEGLDVEPERDEEERDGDEDAVDPQVGVLAEDLPVGPGGRRVEVVPFAALPPRGRLGLRQPGRGRPERRRHGGQRGDGGRLAHRSR